MKKEQKNKNGRVITDYNKIDMIDDYNYYDITRTIINTRCKKHKSLTLSDANKYFQYSDGDDYYFSTLTLLCDKVAKIILPDISLAGNNYLIFFYSFYSFCSLTK